jgi:spore coat protein U-like protein
VSGKGGGLDTTLRALATSDGTAQNAVLTLTNNATIGALTPAATDYTDTITVVGAGLF